MDDPHLFAGRVAVVTGAAAGIGLSIAAALAERGARVVGVDIDGDGLAGTPAVADPITCDLADPGRVAEVMPEVVRRHGGVDILVNAAGIDRRGGFLDADLDDFDLVHRVDLVAPFLLMQASARLMIAQGRGGKIVNVGSSSAFRALAAPPAYAAAKSGLLALTRSAAGELGPHDINVNMVAPGITDTAMLRSSLGDSDERIQSLVESGPGANLMHRVSRPADVAGVVVFLCTDAARQITAQVLHTSAGAVI